MTLHTASIDHLPPELILQILCLLPDFENLHNVVASAHVFYDAFKQAPRIVYTAIGRKRFKPYQVEFLNLRRSDQPLRPFVRKTLRAMGIKRWTPDSQTKHQTVDLLGRKELSVMLDHERSLVRRANLMLKHDTAKFIQETPQLYREFSVLADKGISSSRRSEIWMDNHEYRMVDWQLYYQSFSLSQYLKAMYTIYNLITDLHPTTRYNFSRPTLSLRDLRNGRGKLDLSRCLHWTVCEWKEVMYVRDLAHKDTHLQALLEAYDLDCLYEYFHCPRGDELYIYYSIFERTLPYIPAAETFKKYVDEKREQGKYEQKLSKAKEEFGHWVFPKCLGCVVETILTEDDAGSRVEKDVIVVLNSVWGEDANAPGVRNPDIAGLV